MRVKQPLVLAELDARIAARTQPIPANELRDLWRLLKAALAGITQSPRGIEKAAVQKERHLRSYVRRAAATDKPEMLTGVQCGMAITGSGSRNPHDRSLSVVFAMRSALVQMLGWGEGQRVEIVARDGLWVIRPNSNGWLLSMRSGTCKTLSVKVAAHRLRLSRQPTKGYAQRVCEHEVRGQELLIYPPTWGTPKP